jgi:hypothetical protein
MTTASHTSQVAYEMGRLRDKETGDKQSAVGGTLLTANCLLLTMT